MTEKLKYKLLKQLQHKNLTRSQIEKFCTGKTPFDCENEIDALCAEKMILMASDPIFNYGVFKSTPSDLFELADSGKDYLANRKRELILSYIPIIVSILTLLTAIISVLLNLILIY